MIIASIFLYLSACLSVCLLDFISLVNCLSMILCQHVLCLSAFLPDCLLCWSVYLGWNGFQNYLRSVLFSLSEEIGICGFDTKPPFPIAYYLTLSCAYCVFTVTHLVSWMEPVTTVPAHTIFNFSIISFSVTFPPIFLSTWLNLDLELE